MEFSSASRVRNARGGFGGSRGPNTADFSAELRRAKAAVFGFSGCGQTERRLSPVEGPPSLMGSKNSGRPSACRRLLECPSAGGKLSETAKNIQQIEAFMATSCAQHVPEPNRGVNIRKVIDNIGRIYPSLSNVLLLLRRYLKDYSNTMEAMQEAQRCSEKDMEQRIYKKYEGFFEEKILQLLRARRKAETIAKQLRDEIFELRRERDNDLMKAKETVMVRLNECERKEDEFNSFRKLVASVFKTNESLVDRVEELELILRKHRIDIPRENEDLYMYNKPKSDNTAALSKGNEIKKITDQVPLSFIEASRAEMNLARLSLQKELLNSAFDDRTAYRLQINGLRNDNCALQIQIEALQNQVEDLERYIYEKRFLPTEAGSAEGLLTPRPRDVPFAVQTDLGIDLKYSTAQLVLELASVGINLKHQLNSAVMTLRQLTYAVEWMDSETMLRIADEAESRGVLPTFPPAAWSNIPHFLRTHVEPDVPNLGWSETEVACLLFDLFSNYSSLRTGCCGKRDGKMLAPRTYKLFERCQHPMVRLDATPLEMKQSEDNVPFGYVVSFFIMNMLKTTTPNSEYSRLLQPGTLNPVFVNSGQCNTVEMEFGKCCYNLWYSAQRFKEQQPLCRFFLDVVDGRLPVRVFDVMQRVLRVVEVRVRKADTDGSGSFTYQKLVSTALKLVADMDGQVGRGVALAVMETFKTNQVPLVAGRIFIPSILAMESSAQKQDTHRSLRSRARMSVMYARKSQVHEQPQGASVLTRFWRRLVIQRYERVYSLLEKILGPLVMESQVVIGLFLLPIPAALAAVRAFDEENATLIDESLSLRYPSLSENVTLQGDPTFVSEAPDAPRFTDEYRRMLRMQTTGRNNFKGVSLEKIVTTVSQELQLLSRSMHFPFEKTKFSSRRFSDAETVGKCVSSQTENESLLTKESTKRKRGKRKRKGASKTATEKQEQETEASSPPDLADVVPYELTVKADKELAEWYGFCFAVRQSPLVLPENIFSEDVLVTEDMDRASRSGTDVTFRSTAASSLVNSP